MSNGILSGWKTYTRIQAGEALSNPIHEFKQTRLPLLAAYFSIVLLSIYSQFRFLLFDLATKVTAKRCRYFQFLKRFLTLILAFKIFSEIFFQISLVLGLICNEIVFRSLRDGVERAL